MEAFTFVLFGATGDLAKRKIFPALYNLFLDGKLSNAFSIVGLGRREWTDDTFQKHVEESINSFSRRTADDESKMEEFLQAFCYSALDVTDENGYKKLLEKIEEREEERAIPGNRLFYLSVAPEFIDVITTNINKSGVGAGNGWKRLIIEKPFGHDLKSAQELNEKLSKAFEENEIYRIDHYLGKPMVQNLEALKTANPVIASLFNNQYISNVQITASETVGVEERAGYYDQAGAIRDMFQNHMLQMLMMTSMQLPEQMSPEHIRNEKRKIMESLRPLQKEEVASHVIRGQYGSGEIAGTQVEGYKEEPGIEECSTNDTFVAARLWIDNDAWGGVPFYIRTGKRMEKKSTRIVIEFKDKLEHTSKAGQKGAEPNLLTIEIGPHESVSLQLNLRNPVNHGNIERASLSFSDPNKDVPEAYESLIYDALRGDPTFFAHWSEVELSWKWVQPVLEAFEANSLPLHTYESGSMGPEAAHQLLADDEFKWW
ncbi:glucose-6-phosphate dehydrogenase [Bacillus sp. B190/17]|uniref:Glucose-6-phosphate 1-dehydrogenase n=1 Tax=Bacillus lumedeiriae TaxID=3058829 RepID=A0ABW8IAW2_9BACI